MTTTQTPAAIDAALAAIYTRAYQVQDRAAKVTGWLTSVKDHAGSRYDTAHAEAQIARYEAQLNDLAAQEAAIFAETLPYENEYNDRRWTRFFLVQDGHVHSSMRCQTCNRGGRATRFGWLPEWSGKTEAEVIADLEAQGTGRSVMLCSVCFPHAPVTLHDKPVDDTVCPGSGAGVDNDTRRHFGRSGTCRTCRQPVSVTSTGRARKHKA